jgi:hypothetical protein
VSGGVHEVEEWKHAHRVLDAPLSASPAAIKQNYRKLVKRWHPDLFASGSVEQAEASDMTRLINEAYASIARAMLRYYTEPQSPHIHPREVRPGFVGGRPAQPSDWSGGPVRTSAPRTATRSGEDPYPNADRIEFWVQLLMGLAFGGFFGLVVLLELYVNVEIEVWVEIAIAIGVMVTFTLGSVKQGDKFWRAIFSDFLSWE